MQKSLIIDVKKVSVWVFDFILEYQMAAMT